VRIITGKYGGRTLVPVPDLSIRPAMDRVKSTIFNMLQNRLALAGATVLDLFAGSGSLGLECISRGAGRCVFVDSEEQALDIIRRNAVLLGCADQCDLVLDDAASYIQVARQKFDLCFADPPYAFEATAQLPAMIGTAGILTGEAYLIIEHTRKVRFDLLQGFSSVARKEFGATVVTFLSTQQGEPIR
jgi:16S rRNA (guanine966-N2)-methyltransferase